MSLNEFWFILITILFVGFFVLEGFDFGVGIVSRFLGKNDREKRLYINTIGPFWDANEVWLITAGGAMFAAYPHWYATMFSGFYIPLVFMLLALILRGVSFEFRGKVDSQRWRNTWDWALWFGSFLPPILWGVVLANFMTGMPINQDKEMVGSFLQFLHPFALLGGIMFLMLTITHGLQFITIRTTGELQERARNIGRKVAPVTIILFLAFIVVGYFISDVFTYHGQTFMVIPILAWVSLLFANLYNNQKLDLNAFILTTITIILLTGSIFIGMFPRVMISSISDAYSLTVYNAASGAYTLKVMTYFSLTLLPFVLGYTAWSYFIFRKRLKKDDELEY
ncbi:cytochrome d ubiquinol oxidase subunit II [Pseudogracilibacillus auburnensis]|uniref:Cytochrome bd-I ubiquinol oxidase subunit 2 apoprotein n=1 Tax=Pseudogracilibacillus auburnensis TaxID=1494959 RepID=A0A2V3VMT5_9BACI|nr:cytochrome d ubiquinol oxidase subunit II [Pseudogracilibacillus auburnensis]MBO1001413.1 cytochrome d ubiquinol oxidase subunit II [Pseudogracilibacillus auburnensis]PXW82494.1 cytochrome bd-I ubiquinol oxidase subunit 2 apoprotein [Pseudogracilibacillus auburnensis]